MQAGGATDSEPARRLRVQAPAGSEEISFFPEMAGIKPEMSFAMPEPPFAISIIMQRMITGAPRIACAQRKATIQREALSQRTSNGAGASKRSAEASIVFG